MSDTEVKEDSKFIDSDFEYQGCIKFDFSTLEKCLQHLFHETKRNSFQLSHLQEQYSDLEAKYNNTSNKEEQIDDEIVQLYKKISVLDKTVKKISKSTEDKVFTNEKRVTLCEDNMSALDTRIQFLIDSFKKSGIGTKQGITSIDLDAFEKICQHIRKEMKEYYVRKTDQSQMNKELEDSMEHLKSNISIMEDFQNNSMVKLREIDFNDKMISMKKELESKIHRMAKNIPKQGVNVGELRMSNADHEKIIDFETKIRSFEDKMTHFQIEIKTIEKLMREDITSIEKYKLDVFKGEQFKTQLDDLKNILKSQDMKAQKKFNEISDNIVDNLIKRINLQENKGFDHFKKIKELISRFNLFENKMEGILKAPTDGVPIKKAEIDQERLRYLEKKCQALVVDFEKLDAKTQNRINEVIASVNRKVTPRDLENKEFEILDKFDDFKEEFQKKFDTKTKKQTNHLERHIGAIYSCIMKLDKIKKNIENEEGTVFSKIKIPNTSCASCGVESANTYAGAGINLPWSKLFPKFKKKGIKEEEESPKKEKEIDLKLKKIEESIEQTIQKLNIVDIKTEMKNKPQTAGFMTTRNRKEMIMSSDKLIKHEMQFSPEPEEKFFEKRISTGNKATRYSISRSTRRKK
ncbi:unnamed protein product [Moneuplotes crassus]|uniref:Uncharacterized protein n=1 Tax=Euplotes crassus TaxID=5936 RepID=A0AAD1X7E8_EUPCR|nr:unnamed protein product [Moneuplotes crassus]